MARKKITSGKGATKASEPEADESTRFLAVLLKDGKIRGEFHITDALAKAKSAEPAKKEKEEAKPKPTTNGFAQLQHQIIERIGVYRSLDDTMIMLHGTNAELQFAFSVKSKLRRYAKLIHEDDERRVYSFDRVNAREIIGSIRRAGSGVQGVAQLPKLVLIGLISEYDVFLHDLIGTGLRVKSEVLGSIDRNISLHELVGFASIKEAADFLVEKEIDSILHEDHREQLLAINRLFKIKIDIEDQCVTSFLEICERRNLFTHNAGIVNERYLSKCAQFKAHNSKVKTGDELRVDHKYFRQAIETTLELSIKLLQFVWRKLTPNEREEADRALNNTAIELLTADDYKLAERLLDYGINHTGVSSDVMRKMMIVNYANAIKLGGDSAKAEAELAKHDWSATNSAFQISVAAVKDDIKSVVAQMKAAVRSGEVSEEELRSWPVFKKARGEKLFQDTFKEIFGRDLISVVSLDAKANAKDLGDLDDSEEMPSKSNEKPTRH